MDLRLLADQAWELYRRLEVGDLYGLQPPERRQRLRQKALDRFVRRHVAFQQSLRPSWVELVPIASPRFRSKVIRPPSGRD